jgi:hypothetical protein
MKREAMSQPKLPGKKHIEQRSLAMHRLIADKIDRWGAMGRRKHISR